MRRKYFDPCPYHLLPPEPQEYKRVRRSNLIAIVILAFFTLGLVITGFIPVHLANLFH